MKVFWSCCLIAVSIICQHTSYAIAVSTEAITTNTTTTTAIPITDVTTVEAQAENADVMNSNPMPTAAKLVRYRRQPPITIIKHIVRSSKRSKPRRRSKRPKIRYGPPPQIPPQPPSYVYTDQSSYYKPHYMPAEAETAPSFGIEDFSNFNLNAADFELPPSSYEAQSMELDFYGHTKERSPYQSIPSVPEPSNEYNGPEFEPSLSYKPLPRKPHQKYGVPKNIEYSTDFNSGFNSDFDFSLYNTYQTQSRPTKDDVSSQYQHIPEESIIPSSHNFKPNRPSSSSSSDYNPDYNKNYDSYDTSQYHPQPETQLHPQLEHHSHPTQTSAGIDITYSPSFEVNSPSSSYPIEEQNSYQPTDDHIHPGNFAEPPERPQQPTIEYNPIQETQSHPGYIGETGSVDYVQPSQELPLNPHHKQPAYDFPKSSYEVPIYDPIPFEASTNDEQEYYPPHTYQPPIGSTTHENNFGISSVPPGPQSVDVISQDTHTSESGASTSSTTKLHRNKTKKRQRHPVIGTTKHVLDVPELKAAFEASRSNKYVPYTTTTSTTWTHNSDPEVNASSFVEEKQNLSSLKPINQRGKEKHFNGEWNPMRIRGSQITTRDSAVTSNSLFTTTLKTKTNRTSIRPRQSPVNLNLNSAKRQTTPRSVSEESNVSIEKSHSKSYYDGTLAPPILTISNIYSNSRLNKFQTPTRSPIPKVAHKNYKTSSNIPLKRTTKSIFDTTHFKSPQNDWGGGGNGNIVSASSINLRSNQSGLNIPKNHKLY